MIVAQQTRDKREDKWYLTHPKDLLPGSFSGKDEDWATWKKDLEDYSEALHPGSRELLRRTDLEKEEIRVDMVAERGRMGQETRNLHSHQGQNVEHHYGNSERQWSRGLEEHEPPVRAASRHSKDERNS